MIRAAEFADQGVTVRLDQTESPQAYTLAVRLVDAPLHDRLSRTYAEVTTALDAYVGVCHLFAAGWSVDAVVDFATSVAPPVADEPEYLACEQAA